MLVCFANEVDFGNFVNQVVIMDWVYTFVFEKNKKKRRPISVDVSTTMICVIMMYFVVVVFLKEINGKSTNFSVHEIDLFF